MNTQTPDKTVKLEDFLTRANALIRALGYLSNSQAKTEGKQSTAELAWLWSINQKPREIMNVSLDYTDKAIAKEILEWVKNIAFGQNEFLDKLFLVGKENIVSEKTRGFAASMINAMQREKNPDKAAAATPDTTAAGKAVKFSEKDLENFFGKAGDKFGRQMIFAGHSQFDSRFGLCHKYSFVDAEGRKVTWLTGTEQRELIQDKVYTVSGTIKRFSSFKQSSECEITRARING